jgi:hypothetical protein
MTTSGFMMSFNGIEKLLKEFNLYRMKGVKSLYKNGVSADFKNNSIKEDYFVCYSTGLNNHDYDFLLKDESYFQFEYDNSGKHIEIRYAFFQNPVDYKSYDEFITEVIISSGLANSIEEAGAIFEPEYEQFLNEQEIKNKYLTVRYDVDYPNYHPIVHSVSHLHIGHQNHLRIPLDKFMTPLRFAVFIIKNVYYREWKTIVETKPHYINQILRKCSNGEVLLNSSSWNNIEKLDIHLK